MGLSSVGKYHRLIMKHYLWCQVKVVKNNAFKAQKDLRKFVELVVVCKETMLTILQMLVLN